MKVLYTLIIFFIFCSLNVLAQTQYDVFVPISTGDSLDATYFVPPTNPPPNGYPTMLFIHGFASSKNSTIPSAKIYAQSGYATFCYSVRGHGNSSGLSTIMSKRERLDLPEVLSYIEDIPFVDTNSIAITGGSQGGLHGLWAAADNLPIKAITSDVIIPDWASDIFKNGAIRYCLIWLLNSSSVRYTELRDTLWSFLVKDDYDSLLFKFSKDRDVDTTSLTLSQKPLVLFLKYQDHYFDAVSGINFFINYAGQKKLYLGTAGHYSDAAYDESYYQFSWITDWFKQFLKNIETGILNTPTYTYAYSSLPMDSSGNFRWKHEEVNELPINDVTTHRFYLHPDGGLDYSLPAGVSDSVELMNDYRDSTYNFEQAYIEGFGGSGFDSAFTKHTLIFETKSLKDSVLMFGAPHLSFYVKSDADKFPINAQIYEVDTTGNKYFINRINYVFRNNTTGQPLTIEASGNFHAHRFQAKNKIRVELTNIDKTNRKILGSLPFVLPVFKHSRNIIMTNENNASYIELPLLASGIVTKVSDEIPLGIKLAQNYPNPFNPVTTIEYSIFKTENVSVKIYDVLGREVKTLFEGKQSAGSYTCKFDGTLLSSGVYFYKLQTGSYTAVQKMMLIK
jgi:predicted acyl esterase